MERIGERLIPSDLGLDRPWSIGEASFGRIVAILERANVRTVVECGSGASSARLARGLPYAKIISFEHERKFWEEARRIARKYVPESRLELRHEPLKKRWIGSALYDSYANMDVAVPIDAIVVDGPPYFTRRGREACLYRLYDRLRVGGVVILDDYERASERRIVRNWRAVYPESFEFTEIRVGHGLAVLVKRKHERPRWRVPARLADNYVQIVGAMTGIGFGARVFKKAKHFARTHVPARFRGRRSAG